MLAALEVLGTLLASQDVLKRYTTYPFLICTRSADGQSWGVIMVSDAEYSTAIFDLPGAGECFPVSRLSARRGEPGFMPAAIRPLYRAAYQAYWLWVRASDKGVAVNDMRPHIDFDPIQLDEDTERWVKPADQCGPRFCGD